MVIDTPHWTTNEAVVCDVLAAAARIRGHAEQVMELRDALNAAYAARLVAVRDSHDLITTAGPAEFARIVGNRPDGRPFVHDTQLITWTRDLRKATS